jgi:hypothetical protein
MEVKSSVFGRGVVFHVTLINAGSRLQCCVGHDILQAFQNPSSS